MGSVSLGDRVGFPDVELHAAGSVLSSSSIWVRRRSVPSLRVGLSINELNVSWALSITVSSSVVSTGVVSRVLAKSTVMWHLGEVESSVDTAWQLRNIDVESELSVNESEHFKLIVTTHEIVSGSDVLSVLTVGNESELQGIVVSVDTVGVVPGVFVDSVNSAVLSALNVIWAERAIPVVASVAVGVASVVVEPSPVGVKNDRSNFSAALVGSRTLGPGKRQVLFLGVVSNLLGGGNGSQSSKGKSHGK